ncbi:hypothetical protein L7F22_021395 [Adiantum nelumboides]|nr:hypothetical protein [Adiantum nelumboides]
MEALGAGYWVQAGFYKNLNFILKLITKCWETDPSMLPTFATLCLLLQHRLRCSPPFGKGPWLSCSKDYGMWFRGLQDKSVHRQCFKGRLVFRQIPDSVEAGLKVIGRIVVDQLSFTLKTAARYWELTDIMAATFASVNLLFLRRLWRSFPCELEGFSSCWFNDNCTWLKELPVYLDQQCNIWRSILRQIQDNVEAIGLEATGRIVDELEVRDRFQVKKEDRTNSCATIVRTYLQARKIIVERPSFAWRQYRGRQNQEDGNLRLTRMLLNQFLETSDSLILMKGEACITMLKQAGPINLYRKVYGDYLNFPKCGAISLLLKVKASLTHVKGLSHDTQVYRPDYFNFANDEAHSQLEADTSLLPSLVSFWTLKDFNAHKCFHQDLGPSSKVCDILEDAECNTSRSKDAKGLGLASFVTSCCVIV